MIPGASAVEGDGATNTALKKIPLMLTVKKDFEYFSDFIGEFGAHLYPEGMFIPSDRPKPKGSAVRIDFRMRDGFQILLATGEVVRADANVPGAANGMWVSFRVLDPEQAALIKRIVDQREALAGQTPPQGTPTAAPAPAPAPAPEGMPTTEAQIAPAAEAVPAAQAAPVGDEAAPISLATEDIVLLPEDAIVAEPGAPGGDEPSGEGTG